MALHNLGCRCPKSRRCRKYLGVPFGSHMDPPYWLLGIVRALLMYLAALAETVAWTFDYRKTAGD